MARYSDSWRAGEWHRWRCLRVRVFTRDGHRCRCCGRAGNLELDHVKPPRRGGDVWDEANLQSLCTRCHRTKSDRENRRDPTPQEAEWREFAKEIVTGD